MSQLVRNTLSSEFKKIATLRWPFWLATGLVAVTGLGVWSSMGPAARDSGVQLSGSNNQLMLFDATGIAAIGSIVIGALIVAGEFRFGTLTSALLVTPRRSRLFYAKIVVAAAAGTAVGFLLSLTALIAGSIALGRAGVSAEPTALDQAELLATTAAAAAAFSVVGAGVAALVGNQTTALGIGIGLTVVVGPVVSAAFPQIGMYLPMEAARSLGPGATDTGESLGAITSALVVTGWVLGACLFGYLRFTRRRW